MARLVKDENGQTKGAMVQDMMTNQKWEVAAKAVINATGCFCDAIRCANSQPNTRPFLAVGACMRSGAQQQQQQQQQ